MTNINTIKRENSNLQQLYNKNKDKYNNFQKSLEQYKLPTIPNNAPDLTNSDYVAQMKAHLIPDPTTINNLRTVQGSFNPITIDEKSENEPANIVNFINNSLEAKYHIPIAGGGVDPQDLLDHMDEITEARNYKTQKIREFVALYNTLVNDIKNIDVATYDGASNMFSLINHMRVKAAELLQYNGKKYASNAFFRNNHNLGQFNGLVNTVQNALASPVAIPVKQNKHYEREDVFDNHMEYLRLFSNTTDEIEFNDFYKTIDNSLPEHIESFNNFKIKLNELNKTFNQHTLSNKIAISNDIMKYNIYDRFLKTMKSQEEYCKEEYKTLIKVYNVLLKKAEEISKSTKYLEGNADEKKKYVGHTTALETINRRISSIQDHYNNIIEEYEKFQILSLEPSNIDTYSSPEDYIHNNKSNITKVSLGYDSTQLPFNRNCNPFIEFYHQESTLWREQMISSTDSVYGPVIGNKIPKGLVNGLNYMIQNGTNATSVINKYLLKDGFRQKSRDNNNNITYECAAKGQLIVINLDNINKFRIENKDKINDTWDFATHSKCSCHLESIETKRKMEDDDINHKEKNNAIFFHLKNNINIVALRDSDNVYVEKDGIVYNTNNITEANIKSLYDSYCGTFENKKNQTLSDFIKSWRGIKTKAPDNKVNPYENTYVYESEEQGGELNFQIDNNLEIIVPYDQTESTIFNVKGTKYTDENQIQEPHKAKIVDFMKNFVDKDSKTFGTRIAEFRAQKKAPEVIQGTSNPYSKKVDTLNTNPPQNNSTAVNSNQKVDQKEIISKFTQFENRIEDKIKELNTNIKQGFENNNQFQPEQNFLSNELFFQEKSYPNKREEREITEDKKMQMALFKSEKYAIEKELEEQKSTSAIVLLFTAVISAAAGVLFFYASSATFASLTGVIAATIAVAPFILAVAVKLYYDNSVENESKQKLNDLKLQIDPTAKLNIGKKNNSEITTDTSSKSKNMISGSVIHLQSINDKECKQPQSNEKINEISDLSRKRNKTTVN